MNWFLLRFKTILNELFSMLPETPENKLTMPKKNKKETSQHSEQLKLDIMEESPAPSKNNKKSSNVKDNPPMVAPTESESPQDNGNPAAMIAQTDKDSPQDVVSSLSTTCEKTVTDAQSDSKQQPAHETQTQTTESLVNANEPVAPEPEMPAKVEPMPIEVKKSFSEFGFTIDMEKKIGNGEDAPPLLLEFEDETVLLGVFDGLGGAGGTRYEIDGQEKSGAYFASRLIQKATNDYFIAFKACGMQVDSDFSVFDLQVSFSNALKEGIKKLPKNDSKVKSKLMKRFPTTVAIHYLETKLDKVFFHAIWAGDSRCYALDTQKGLLQLTSDDLKKQNDAFENIFDDAPMSNFVNADTNYQLNYYTESLTQPCLLFAATDGCFGYVHTPMHFEYLLLQCLIQNESVEAWKADLMQQFKEIQADDISLSMRAVGFTDFKEIKAHFTPRLEELNALLKDFGIIDGQLIKSEKALSAAKQHNLALSADLSQKEVELSRSKNTEQEFRQNKNRHITKIKDINIAIERKKQELALLEKEKESLLNQQKTIDAEIQQGETDYNKSAQEYELIKSKIALLNDVAIQQEHHALKAQKKQLGHRLWSEYKQNYESYLDKSQK